jgi:hypothetical protein
MWAALKKITLTKSILNIIALILGYSLWSILSQKTISSRFIEIPLCFYNTTQHTNLEAPEFVAVTLSGSRINLKNLDINQLALHVNAQNLSSGPNLIVPDRHNLLLPETINVLHYKPTNIMVTLNNNRNV